MELTTRRNRRDAWKKTMTEKFGRDHLSSIQGYVVAGCVLDILDDIWDRNELKIIKQLEEEQKNHYNVYVYGLLRYPPVCYDVKKFLN